MTLKEVQQKLYEKLVPSGWGNKLKTFILSDEFYRILEHLNKSSEGGKRFTPVIKDIFRAFEECPYDELKVVMVAPGPYTPAGLADGIAFSCIHPEKMQPQLEYMFKEIESTVYKDGYTWDKDLTRWSNQGILMLNTALTTEVDKLNEHTELWRPFTTFLFDVLSSYNSGIVYVFMGDAVKPWHNLVANLNYKYFTTDPISAHYTEEKIWNSGNLFVQINKVIKDIYKEEIIW
jgi:uracil-DNA glycosylase